MNTTQGNNLESRIDYLESIESIRAVLFLYCQAADRCDAEMMQLCYHDDAIDDHGFFSGPAKDFCVFVTDRLREIERSVHSISNINITIENNRALCVCQYTAIHRIKNFLGFTDFIHQGRYFDIFERRDGRWKIAKRMICQDGERWVPTANLGFLVKGRPNTPIQGSKDKGDPSYLGFKFVNLIAARPVLSNIWQGFIWLSYLPVWMVRLLTIGRN